MELNRASGISNESIQTQYFPDKHKTKTIDWIKTEKVIVKSLICFYNNLVVISTKVLKQETELLPTASKKLTQPPKLAYYSSLKFKSFLQLSRAKYSLKSWRNHFILICIY